MTISFHYTGEKQDPSNPYLPSKDLVEAINVSITLGRPLLLKGEPGSGKTKLADAVAFEFGIPIYRWFIKSTSRARDGLYRYDAVGRLRDAQLAGNPKIKEINALKPISDYVEYGALGKAIRNMLPAVVLIDEIDKADIDFPNDLLRELDEMAFTVDELPNHPTYPDESEEAPLRPLVFITSNDEKELPDAFLRRCVFYYIEFPNRERLINIINEHYKYTEVSSELQLQIIDKFIQLREQMNKDLAGSGKNVSTSELLDWFKLLSHHSGEELLELLGDDGKVPYPSVLFKTWDSHQRYLLSKSGT